ncbi:MAG: TrbI/VirB10 family protein [Prosthecobacter sp.]|jgi:hypothetical protein|nr:TrbI/VirB10 family protein [Prosthecobacter sp.]
MMKHLQKPAVQMVLLIVVVGIAAAVFYSSRKPVNAVVNAPKVNKEGQVVNTIVAEDKTVKQEDRRVTTVGDDQQVQPLYVQPKKQAPPSLVSTSSKSTGQKPPPPPPYPKLAHVANPVQEDFTPQAPTLFAPRGLLIKAALVLTVDSSSLETPVLALVTEDVYWNRKLIVPAGTQVLAKAAQGRVRDRIEVKGQYTFVWADGREYNISCIALDHEREADGTYGITDGSSGIRGQIIKNDQYAELKIMVAEALQGLMNNNQTQFQSIYGLVPDNTSRNAALGGGSQAASAYSQLLTKKLDQDLDFVRVAAGTQFYIYTLAVFEPELASVAGLKQGGKEASSWQIAQEAYARAEAQNTARAASAADTAAATRKAEEEKRAADRAARVNELIQGGSPAGAAPAAPEAPTPSSNP